MFSQVLVLWRRDRATLGFLPTEGFEDRAERGTLLAAVDSGTVAGYVLYDLPGDRVKLVHLCVERGKRDLGVARVLIDELSRRHADRQRIELACRRDYPAANHAWPALGFVAAYDRPGRSTAGHLLTVWVKDHGHPHLFSEVADGVELAFLDTNIVIDWATQQRDSWSSRLREDWLAEYVEYAICDEVPNAIHRRADDTERAASQNEARQLRLITPPATTWKAIIPGLAELLPTAEPEDHRSLAKAIVSKADYFVTRDDVLNAAGDTIRLSFGIEVLRPEGFIRRIDRLRSGERYEPSALHGTAIRDADPAGLREAELVQTFQNYASGERKVDFQRLLRSALAQPEILTTRVLLDANGRPVGLWAREVIDGELHVRIVRAGLAGPIKDAIARQLAFLPRQQAADDDLGAVLISDPAPSEAVTRALPVEGYREETVGRWRATVKRGLCDANDVDLPDTSPPDRVTGGAEYERIQWPAKVLGTGIQTYLIPIRLAFAEQLFDAILAEQTLFDRVPALGLSREHVYYRKPTNHRGICAGSRILWYVTGTSPGGQQEAHVRAISQVRKVTVAPPESLLRRNSRLGVWTPAKVKAEADRNGRVMAIRFGDTELFAHPVSLTELRALHAAEGLRFHHPLSPQVLPEHMFCLVYRQGSTYAA